MAALFKRYGLYYASFYDRARTPQRKQIALRTRERAEAERLKVRLEDLYEACDYDPWDAERQETHLTADLSRLGDAVTAFIEAQQHRSVETIRKYRSVLGLLIRYLGPSFPTVTLTARRIEAFLKAVPRAPVTRRTYLTTVSPFTKWLFERRVLKANVAASVRLERVPQVYPRFLMPEEIEALVAAIHDECSTNKHAAKGTSAWLIPVVRANAYLGLRAGELVHVTWSHVDLDRGTLHVAQSEHFRTKNGRDRVIPLCEEVKTILRALPQTSPYVFPSHTGRQLGKQYVSRRFKHFARKAHLTSETCFHSLRHTAASWLVMGGASLEAARLYLGHGTISVTARYAHLAPGAYARQISGAFEAMTAQLQDVVR